MNTIKIFNTIELNKLINKVFIKNKIVNQHIIKYFNVKHINKHTNFNINILNNLLKKKNNKFKKHTLILLLDNVYFNNFIKKKYKNDILVKKKNIKFKNLKKKDITTFFKYIFNIKGINLKKLNKFNFLKKIINQKLKNNYISRLDNNIDLHSTLFNLNSSILINIYRNINLLNKNKNYIKNYKKKDGTTINTNLLNYDLEKNLKINEKMDFIETKDRDYTYNDFSEDIGTDEYREEIAPFAKIPPFINFDLNYSIFNLLGSLKKNINLENSIKKENYQYDYNTTELDIFTNTAYTTKEQLLLKKYQKNYLSGDNITTNALYNKVIFSGDSDNDFNGFLDQVNSKKIDNSIIIDSDIKDFDIYNSRGYEMADSSNFYTDSFKLKHKKNINNSPYMIYSYLNYNTPNNKQIMFSNNSIIKDYDIPFLFYEINQLQKYLKKENKIFTRKLSKNSDIIKRLFFIYFDDSVKNNSISDVNMPLNIENKLI